MTLSIEDTDAYPKAMLQKTVTDTLAPAKWWKIVEKKHQNTTKLATPAFCQLMTKISSLPASSASVERLFSTFGLVHTKLRNRLGNEKTEKLVMCHRTLRDQKDQCDDW